MFSANLFDNIEQTIDHFDFLNQLSVSLNNPSIDPVYSSETRAQKVFQNVGNSCYIHAAVQIIAAIPNIENTLFAIKQNLNFKQEFEALQEKSASEEEYQAYFNKIQKAFIKEALIFLILFLKQYNREDVKIKSRENLDRDINFFWLSFVRHYEFSKKRIREQNDVSEVVQDFFELLDLKNPAFSAIENIEVRRDENEESIRVRTIDKQNEKTLLTWPGTCHSIQRLFSQKTPTEGLAEGRERNEFVLSTASEAPSFLVVQLLHNLTMTEGFCRTSYSLPFEASCNIQGEGALFHDDYILASVSGKMGGSNGGHYVQYNRRGNTWFKYDDRQAGIGSGVEQITFLNTAEFLGNQGEFYPVQVLYVRKDHFAKESGLAPDALVRKDPIEALVVEEEIQEQRKQGCCLGVFASFGRKKNTKGLKEPLLPKPNKKSQLSYHRV